METTAVFEGDIRKKYFQFSLPIVLSMVITIIYNIADTYFVSMTQNSMLVAGVSLCTPLFTALQSLGNLFGQGGGSLISRLLGAGEKEQVKKVSSFGWYTALGTGFAAAVFLYLLRRPILYLLGADASTYMYAEQYYSVLSIGAPIIVLGFIHMNYVRCEGLAKQSMFGSALGAILNIVLDPLFIIQFQMGAAGAAVATLVGYVCSDLYFVVLVRRKSPDLSMDIRKIRITWKNFRQIMGIGFAAALMNIVQGIGLIVTNQALLPYGSETIAAMGIAQKVILVVFLIIVGFSFGGQPLIGYFYGARRLDDFRKLIRFSTVFLVIFSVILSALLFVLARPLVGAFLKDTEIIAMGTYMLRWQLVTMGLDAILMSVMIVFQSIGRVPGSVILSASRQGIIYIPVLIVLASLVGYDGVAAAQAVADVISFFVAAGCYCFLMKKIKTDVHSDG